MSWSVVTAPTKTRNLQRASARISPMQHAIQRRADLPNPLWARRSLVLDADEPDGTLILEQKTRRRLRLRLRRRRRRLGLRLPAHQPTIARSRPLGSTRIATSVPAPIKP